MYLYLTDDYGDTEADISDSVRKESNEKLDTTSPDAVDHDNSSIGDSNSDISTNVRLCLLIYLQ